MPAMVKRGAQPGNLNALKNGFYSRQFRELENADLSQVSEGLKDEILCCGFSCRAHCSELANYENGDLEQMAAVSMPWAWHPPG